MIIRFASNFRSRGICVSFASNWLPWQDAISARISNTTSAISLGIGSVCVTASAFVRHASTIFATFPKAPTAFETFKLNGKQLTGTGAGTVRIRTPRGRVLTRKLPFSVNLPKR